MILFLCFYVFYIKNVGFNCFILIELLEMLNIIEFEMGDLNYNKGWYI